MAALLRGVASRLLPKGNSRHFLTRTMEETGLYGIQHLKNPKGFQRFVDDAIERSNELVSYISGMPPAAEIVSAMDEISDTVCSVVDSAELCRNTHPDREFVDEATKASMRINEYLHFLNTNHSLYNAVLKAEQDPTLVCEETKRVAHDLRVDLEKGGIHLSEEKLDRVNQLNVEIAKLCSQFNANISEDPGHCDVFPAGRIPKLLHHLVKPIYRSSSPKSRDNIKEKGFRILTEPTTVSTVLQWATDDEVRKMIYIQGNSVPHANLEVLDKLIAARHEIGQIMGYKSYAAYALHSNMASSPEVVSSFLLEMSKIVQSKAVEEFNTIWDFKKELSGNKNVDLEPWDEAYITRSMKSSAFNLDFLAVSSFFPLSQCIEGLKVLVESLFGMTFHSIPLAPGESWHPDVLKMSLHHPDEGDIGYLYLDLNSRKGKYPGCAHFAIRGGRRISASEYQLPVVALVCNFSKSRNSSPLRLDHSEVETFFHEFGHALHSLLSRTNYQHFSGTRVVFDMAETPSNLFEYYAWDYRVLKKFAKHYSTGDIIPEKLVESLQGAKRMFSAMELQQQVFYALVDQTLYGDQTCSSKDTVSVVADLKREHTCWKHVEGTHWHTRFRHLLYYGAGYYSYLYAKCFASTIWQKVCNEDPLSLSTGTAIRTKFLQHGGSRDPALLLNDLAGGGIIKKLDEGIVPDIASLCNEMGLTSH